METRTAVLRLYRRIAPKAALLMVVYYCECYAVTNFAAALVLDRVGGVEKDTTCGALMRQTVLISGRVRYSSIPHNHTTHRKFKTWNGTMEMISNALYYNTHRSSMFW